MKAWWTVLWAVARRTTVKVLRRPVVLTFSLAQPLVWMALFGFLFQRFRPGELPPGRGYLDFLAPGVSAMSVLFGASQAGVTWIRDFQTGFLSRWLATPAPRSALLGGKLTADVGRLLVQAWVVLGVAWLLGVELVVSPALLPAGLGLAFFAAFLAGISSGLALRARAPEAMGAFIHLVNMPLLFSSTALVPDREMPDWLAQVAQVNPLTLAVEAWRGALLEGSGTPWPHLAILAVLALGTCAWARWELVRAGDLG